jgi:hypothetical protein
MKKRPFGVTVLAILTGALAVLSGLFALQSLGILPFFVGQYKIHAFSFWSFLMWALMAWIYVWVTQMLWNMEKSGWLFVAVISAFNLILDFTVMLSQDGAWSDVSVHFLLNAIILIYVMLPGVRQAFEPTTTS